MSQLSLESLHRFHPYCARFPSEIVEAALEKYSNPGDSIFDPFCGSETTLVASLVYKRKAVGIDIDTLAVMISEVKCTPFAPEQYAAWRSSLRPDWSETSRDSHRPGDRAHHRSRERFSRLAH
jgi:hypothetical protein